MPKFLIIFFCLTSFHALCTVDYLCANDITKELYWADTDNPPGLIGWKNLPENYETIEKQKIDEGYAYTSFPYKLDLASILSLILLIGFLRKRFKNR